MPEINRSDSQRSDSSIRPRVSFNRDVHIKKIGHPDAPSVVGALAGDGEGHLVPTAVRREGPNRLSRRELAKEAERVLKQADSVVCVPLSGDPVDDKPKTYRNNIGYPRSNSSNKYNSTGADVHDFPSKKQGKPNLISSVFNSLDRSKSRKGKPGRDEEDLKYKYRRSSLHDESGTNSLPRSAHNRKSKPRLERSVSDVGGRKPPNRKPEEKKAISIFATLDRLRHGNKKNKPYYTGSKSDVEVKNVVNKSSHMPKNGEAIDSSYIAARGFTDNPSPVVAPRRKKKQLSPIIEITPREDYFEPAPEKKHNFSLGGGDYESPEQKPRSTEREKTKRVDSYSTGSRPEFSYRATENGYSDKDTKLPNGDSSDIGAKILATPSPARAPTIHRLIQKLSEERRNRSPPNVSTTSPLIQPDEGRQHNDNKPFSYIEPPTAIDGGHVIYAQVLPRGGVHGNPAAKQTIHATVGSNQVHENDRITVNVDKMGQDRKINDSPSSRALANRQKLFDEFLPEEKILNMIRAQSNPVLLEDDLIPEEKKSETIIKTVLENDDPFGTRGRGDGMELTGRRNSSFDVEYSRKNSLDSADIGRKDDLSLFKEKYGSLLKKRSPSLNENEIGLYGTPAKNLSYRRNLLESKIESKQRRLSLTASQVNPLLQAKNLKNSLTQKPDPLIDPNASDLTKGRLYKSKLVTEIDTHQQHSLKHKDVSDSGIELSDYRKESLNGAPKKLEPGTRAKIENRALYHQKTITTRSKPSYTDTENATGSDVERPPRSKLSSKSFSSAKTVEEKRRRSDSIPSSSTLVRRYSQTDPKYSYMQQPRVVNRKKLSKMEKVKQFFGMSGKRRKSDKDEVTNRYREYKGSDAENSSPSMVRRKTSSKGYEYDNQQEQDYYAVRQRLATPSPVPPSEATTVVSNGHSRRISDDRNTWFKSLDRLTHKNKTKPSKAVSKLRPNAVSEGSENDEEVRIHHISTPRRNSNDRTLRFSDSEPEKKPQLRSRKYTTDSSPDSNTEGDSHQSSQKSVVYLHAATVGDIPGSKKLHSSVLNGGRRAMSREELSSNNSVSLAPHKRTLSRSISVLAPWRPKHYRESMEIDYSKEQTDGKPPKHPLKQKNQGLGTNNGKGSRRNEKSDQENTLKKKQGNKSIFGKFTGKNRNGEQTSDNESQIKSKKNTSDLIFTGKRENWDSYLGKSIDSFQDYKKDDKLSKDRLDYRSSNSVYNRNRNLSESTNTTDYPTTRKYSTDLSSDTSKLRTQSRASSEYIIPVVRYDPEDSDESKRHILIETIGKERNSKQKEDPEKVTKTTLFPKDAKFSSGWIKSKNKKAT